MARSLIKDSENDMVKQMQIAEAGYSTAKVPHTISEVDLLTRTLTNPTEAIMQYPTTPDADEIEEKVSDNNTIEAQLSSLADYYMGKNWHIQQHYHWHGVPDLDKRLAAMDCCRGLFDSLMQQQVSGRQAIKQGQLEARASGTSRKRVKKTTIKIEGEERTTPNVTLFQDEGTATSSSVDVEYVAERGYVETTQTVAYLQHKKAKQQLFALRHIDELVVARRHITTPSTVSTGLLDYFGNVTERVLALHCQQRLTHSAPVIKHIVNGLVNQLTRKTKKELCAAVASKSTYILTIMDNYNPNRWLKFKAVDEAFTHTIATIATLLRFLPVAIEPTPEQASTPVYYLLDRETIQEHVTRGQGWINIGEEHKNIIDEDYTSQSVKSFSPWPSIPGKSSDHHQVQEKVLDEFLIGSCGMGKKPVFVVLDTEIVAIAGLKQYLKPEKYANLILLPSPFHYRMHLIYNLVLEPVFFLLFWAPYLYEHHVVQKVKIATMVVSIINKLNELKNFQETNRSKVDETYTEAQTGSSSSSNPPPKKAKLSHKALGKTCLNKEEEAESLSKIHLLMLDVLAECADATDNTGLGEDSDSDTDDETGTTTKEAGSTKRTKGTGKKALYDDAQLVQVSTLCRWITDSGVRVHNGGFTYAEMQSRKLSYARVQFMCLTVEHVFMNMVNDTEEYAEVMRTSKNRWTTNLLHDFLLNGLHHLAIKPFADIILRGRAQLFLAKYMDMCNYLSFTNRAKVVRSMYVVAANLHHMSTERQDLFMFYLKNHTKFSDLFIELFNSLTSSRANPHQEQDASHIARNAMETVVYRQIIPPKKPPASRTPDSEFYQYRHEGEVVKEENRPRMKKYTEDNKSLATWIVNHIKRFGSFDEQRQPLPAETFIVKAVSTKPAKGEAKGKKIIRKDKEFDGLTFENSNTIQGCIQFGAHRGKHTILPEYMDYLGKKKDGLDIPDKFSFEGSLEQLTNPWLISFLKSKNVRMWKGLSAKPHYLTYILKHHTKLEVFTFVKEELARKGDSAIGATSNEPSSATTTTETTDD
jgi:hypothetical protein